MEITMKKAILFILSLVFIISVTSCGSTDISESDPTPEKTPVPIPNGSDSIKIIAGDNEYFITMDDIVALVPNGLNNNKHQQ